MNMQLGGGIMANTMDKNDISLVLSAQKGDRQSLDRLIKKYEGLVYRKAKAYFLIGADNDDIVQEGMIGLYKAIRDFSSEKQIAFSAFAEICITRQILTAIKAATRQKHIPLNSYISLNGPAYGEDEKEHPFLDVLESEQKGNPETMVIDKEEYTRFEDVIGKNLSDLEQKVLLRYLQGKSYQEIAHDLKKPVKTVDNALQRIKKKLETIWKGKADD